MDKIFSHHVVGVDFCHKLEINVFLLFLCFDWRVMMISRTNTLAAENTRPKYIYINMHRHTHDVEFNRVTHLLHLL